MKAQNARVNRSFVAEAKVLEPDEDTRSRLISRSDILIRYSKKRERQEEEEREYESGSLPLVLEDRSQ